MLHYCFALTLFALSAALEDQPVVYFQTGLPLDELPGAQMLKQLQPQTQLSITLTPVRLTGPAGAADPLINFVTPVYRNDDTGEQNVFGPTIRAKGGDEITITIANNLTQFGQVGQTVELNGFFHSGRTNLHTHGLHVWPGVEEQTVDALLTYHGGDNIFPTYEPKNFSNAEPTVEFYYQTIGRDHMPGLFWYHPHSHGSTVVQVPTANGLYVIEDNADWLPGENGCSDIYTLLQAAPETFLHLSLLFFKHPDASTRTAVTSKFQNEQWAIDRDDSSIQVYDNLVLPGNPAAEYGITGLMNNSDFLLVNGAWQPVIQMKSGQYQRWRVAAATIKRFEILQIIDLDTQKPAPECEMLLLAKDGHYMMKIPRLVNHIFLAPGNRAELLVKCSGEKGRMFALRAGDAENNPYGGAACNFQTPNNLVQPIVATIRITEDGQDQERPPLEGCTPRRAGYAQDLRDDSLELHNVTDKLELQPITFTMNGAFGCQVNGRNFSVPDSDPIVMPLGQIVEWSLEDLAVHPLHTHTNPMQIIKLPPDAGLLPGCKTNNWFQAGDYHDTLMIPQYQQDAAPVRVRIQPGEYSGISVMHCHSLQHEDMGCMALMFWRCPGFDVSQAQPFPCPGFQFPIPGDYPLSSV